MTNELTSMAQCFKLIIGGITINKLEVESVKLGNRLYAYADQILRDAGYDVIVNENSLTCLGEEITMDWDLEPWEMQIAIKGEPKENTLVCLFGASQ